MDEANMLKRTLINRYFNNRAITTSSFLKKQKAKSKGKKCGLDPFSPFDPFQHIISTSHTTAQQILSGIASDLVGERGSEGVKSTFDLCNFDTEKLIIQLLVNLSLSII
jgi:hypothetical protein